MLRPPRARTVLIALALLGPALAGCLGGPGDPSAGTQGNATEPAGTTIEIPVPETGARFVYHTSDGRQLNVSVGGMAERKDAWLNDRVGRVIEMTYPHVEGGTRFAFEETVDTSTGLVIQQWATCGNLGKEDGRYTCKDARGLAIPAAHGWPGAMGAAPFWGTNLSAGRVSLPLDLIFDNEVTLNLTVQGANTHRPRDCLSLEPDPIPDHLVWTLEFSGGAGAFTLCDGIPLPVAFDSAHEGRLEIDRWTPGDGGHPNPPNGTASADREPVVPLRPRGTPLFAKAPEQETPFPTREAHEIALERSDAYAALFDEAPNATLAFSHYKTGGGSEPDRIKIHGSAREHGRILGAFADDGRWVEVAVVKTIQQAGWVEERQTTYEIREEEDGWEEAPFFQRELLEPEQADLNATIQLGETLTGRPVDEAFGYGSSGFWPRCPWMNRGPDWRPAGAPAVAWYEDATGEASGGITFFDPYRLIVDGPTGAILCLDGPRGNLTASMR